MSQESAGSARRERSDRVEDLLIKVFFAARDGSLAAVIAYAVYALFWDASWGPIWALCGLVAFFEVGLRGFVWRYKIEGRRLRRQVEKRYAEIRELKALHAQQQILLEQTQAHAAALRAENAQKRALIAALETRLMEFERLQLQRRLEQEAREARRKLDLAVAAIEADLLEAAAWRMDVTAKQLELKIQQAGYFQSLSELEENTQERILSAYETGHDHGRRGIVIPAKFSRHLRVVEESA